MSINDVTVVIVNFNSGSQLKICLAHLLQQTLSPKEIFIVDNNSTDDSLDIDIIEREPRINLIRSSTNLGFAVANNIAIKKCKTELVALLNPDAYPQPDWLEKLVESAHLHSDAASFGSKMLCYPERDQLDGIGDVYHFSGLVWRRAHGKSSALVGNVANSRKIFSACAGAALYRRSAFEYVGGFDEDYFCYVEDVDLGFRLQLAGFSSVYVEDAVVEHVGGGTSGGKHSDFSIYYGHRNLIWTFVKNLPFPLMILFLPFHISMNIIAFFYFCWKGKAKVIFKSKIDGIKFLPKMFAKRRDIRVYRKASCADLLKIIDFKFK
ncbi:glycosyltransferase family 2 protein [Vibrio cholerae]|nr:glycosyltransferase family 2 protein [Vibrio cholerae]EIJ0935540.1 glycosyltransferase family 2 protein [Vibrio cholerae]